MLILKMLSVHCHVLFLSSSFHGHLSQWSCCDSCMCISAKRTYTPNTDMNCYICSVFFSNLTRWYVQVSTHMYRDDVRMIQTWSYSICTVHFGYAHNSICLYLHVSVCMLICTSSRNVYLYVLACIWSGIHAHMNQFSELPVLLRRIGISQAAGLLHLLTRLSKNLLPAGIASIGHRLLVVSRV
jgi:hypothetical protein